MKSLSAKSALVTGSSSGIGRSITLALGREGATVTVNYLRPKDEGDAQSIAHQINGAGGLAQIVRAEVGNESDLDRLDQRGGTIWNGP